MKEIFRENDLIKVTFYRQLLEAEGIPCLIRNETLAYSGLTEIPIPEFFPALNVVDDADEQRAREVIRQQVGSQQQAAEAPERACPSCHEMNPGNFTSCWSCNAPLGD